MNTLRLGCLVLVLTAAPAMLAQTAEDGPATDNAPKPEDAQTKSLREQLERESAARKAEADAAIAADIARNPDGKNAQEAKKAAAAKKMQEMERQTAGEKAKADATVAADAATAKVETDRKAAAAQWAAGAPERKRLEAAKKAAVDKWRAGAKPGPSIIMGKRADGTITVMVGGKISTFATPAEAQAYVNKVQDSANSTLSY